MAGAGQPGLQPGDPSGADVLGFVAVLADLTATDATFAGEFRNLAEDFIRRHTSDGIAQVQRKRRREEERLTVIRAAVEAAVAGACASAAAVIGLELGLAAAVVAVLAAATVYPTVLFNAEQFNMALERGEWPAPPPEVSAEADEDGDAPGATSQSRPGAGAKKIAGMVGYFRAGASGRKSEAGRTKPCRSPAGLLPSATVAMQSLTHSERARLVYALLNQRGEEGDAGQSSAWRRARHSIAMVGGMQAGGRRKSQMPRGSMRVDKFSPPQSKPRDGQVGSPGMLLPRASGFDEGSAQAQADPLEASGEGGESASPLRQLAGAAQPRFGELGGFDFQGKGREALAPALPSATPALARALWAEFVRRCRRIAYCEKNAQNPGLGAGAPVDASEEVDRSVAEGLLADPEKYWDVPATLKPWFGNALGVWETFGTDQRRVSTHDTPTLRIGQEDYGDDFE